MKKKLLNLLCKSSISIMLLGSIELANSAIIPSTEVIDEIKGQISELAVANFDSIFANQLNLLISSEGKDDYGKVVMNSFYLLKNFREFYLNSSWANKQKLSLKYKLEPVSEEQEIVYDQLVSDGQILNEVNSLKPNISNYDDYRFYIKKLLNDYQELPKYNYVLLNKKSRGNQIITLRQVLKIKGYLPIDAEDLPTYDEALELAIKTFQFDNNVQSDGVVGRITYDLLYKDNTDKAVSLARSILRLSDPLLKTTEINIVVNIPQAKAFVYKNHIFEFGSTVVVGRPTNQTPLLYSNIDNIVFNPPWNVPPSIKQKEYMPNLERDPYYLQKRGLHLIDKNNHVVTPEQFSEFSQMNGTSGLRIVQKPGSRNALGLYKFNFPNNFSVYLHSTPNMSKFKSSYRYLSHGCVRVEKSRELAEYLLKNTIYTSDEISKIIKNGKTKWVKVEEQPYVFIIYVTSYIDPTHKPIYFIDPYNYDTFAYKLPKGLIENIKNIKTNEVIISSNDNENIENKEKIESKNKINE